MSTANAPRFIRGTRTDHIMNSVIGWLARHGISVYGTRMLYVRGRKTGQWRSAPVNPLTIDGQRFLVAPRGHTNWVRNMRVAGTGELRLGRRVERFTATEIADPDKTPVLRAYLRAWGWEVGKFFEGVTATASDEQLRDIAPDFPIFVIATTN